MAESLTIPVRFGLRQTLRTLLRSWWSTDRIRTFPTTGRILALHTGDRFLMRNQIWTVMIRDVNCGESSAKVRLGICAETENQTAEVIVRASGLAATRAEPAALRINGKVIPIWDEDIVLLPSKHHGSAGKGVK